MIIKTERMVLRPWQEEDLEPFARLNADPRVMEFFPAVRSFEETREQYTRIKDHFSEHGWGMWAAEVDNTFIGFIGLAHVNFTAPFTPAVEVGWRLAYEAWGRGYAPEGAKAALQYGFDVVGLEEIVAITAVQNMRSRRVMEKLGMHHDLAGDFDHPNVPEGNHVRRHVLYRIRGAE